MFFESLESRTLLSIDTAALTIEAAATRAPVAVHLDIPSNSAVSWSDTLLVGAQPRDLIFDPLRRQLLDIEPTRIVRYDANDGRLINSIPLGTSLGGGDITPDGKFLYVSELGSHSIYKVDLQTEGHSSILISDYLGTPMDIAIGDNSAIISQAYQNFGDNVRKINLADDSVSNLWWQDIGPLGTASPSLLARSADYSYVALASASLDASYVNDFTTGQNLSHNGSISALAVSRDGSLHALADSDSLTVFDSSFNTVKTFSHRGAAVAFDPQQDLLYVFDPASNFLQGYDTHSWELIFSFATENVPLSGTNTIVMATGKAGEIFLGTPSGVHLVLLSQGNSFGSQLTLNATVTPLAPSATYPVGSVAFIDHVTGTMLGSASIIPCIAPLSTSISWFPAITASRPSMRVMPISSRPSPPRFPSILTVPSRLSMRFLTQPIRPPCRSFRFRKPPFLSEEMSPSSKASRPSPAAL